MRNANEHKVGVLFRKLVLNFNYIIIEYKLVLTEQCSVAKSVRNKLALKLFILVEPTH